jgi:hypothetical protein
MHIYIFIYHIFVCALISLEDYPSVKFCNIINFIYIYICLEYELSNDLPSKVVKIRSWLVKLHDFTSQHIFIMQNHFRNLKTDKNGLKLFYLGWISKLVILILVLCFFIRNKYFLFHYIYIYIYIYLFGIWIE